MPALYEALPEAQVIQTHRDPLKAIPSECNLGLSLHGIGVSTLDWRQTTAHNYLKVHTYAERSVAFANTAEGNQVMHVDYGQLVRDPVGLARDIHEHFGLAWHAEYQTRLEAFFSANRQHKHGKNHYSLEQFELDQKSINSDFLNYYERFLFTGSTT